MKESEGKKQGPVSGQTAWDSLDQPRAREQEIARAKELEMARARSSELSGESELLSNYEKIIALQGEYLKNAAEMREIILNDIPETSELQSAPESEPEPTEAPAEEPEETLEEPTLEPAPEEPAPSPFAGALEGRRPLTAIAADWTHDRRELARDLAEQTLNAETAKGKLIDRIWKGTLFRKYYEKKYENEFLREERTNEEGKTVKELLKEQSAVTIERFVLGAVEDMKYVHQRIGKKNKDGVYEDGEKLVPADEKTNEAVKKAIEDYARRHLNPDENLKDLNREFKDELARIFATESDLHDKHNESEIGFKQTNFLAVAREAAARYQELAVNARTKAEHDLAMAEVMAGFKVYNADVRNNVRTDAHRDAIDKIVNKLESSKFGRIVPGEIIAGGLGALAALTQTGARAIAGAAGGIIASSAISGLKERNRITEERARMLRDAANGMVYSGEDGTEGLKGAAKKIAKHEARIGGTLYDMQGASSLTKGIEDAINYEGEDRSTRLLQAIAEARVRVSFSDSQQKDLISYSSDKDRGSERLALDIALIRAEKSLSDDEKATLKVMKRGIRRRIINGYEDESGEYHAGVLAKDEEFKNYRALAAMKKAGKTLGIGALTFLFSQEIMAAIDPHKIGIFEKAGILKTENANDAKETLLASGFGLNKGSYTVEPTSQPTDETIENVSDPELAKQYEAAGYQKIKVKDAWSEPDNRYEDINIADSPNKVNVKYDGWAHNGTKIADGNELRAHIENGRFVSEMRGASTYNGGTINYDAANIKAFVTVGNSKFEVVGSVDGAGHLTWGENGTFITTGGETIKAIGDNGERLYKYFEIAADNGVDGEGIQHIIPLATDVGNNTFEGTFRQVIENTVEHPAVYNFIKPAEVIPPETFIREVTTNGVPIAVPDLLRTGIGASYQRNNALETPEMPVEASEASESQPTAPETEAASEPILNVPEVTFEPETEPETEADRWSDEILGEIYENADLIGGEEGIFNLTDRNPFDDRQQGRWQAWWEGLSDDGRGYIRDLVNRIESSDYHNSLTWGNNFRLWFALNGYN